MKNSKNTTNNELRESIIKDITDFLAREKSIFEQKTETEIETTVDEHKEDIDATVQHVAEASVQKAVDTNISKQLRDIKKALNRIESGIYGVCTYCDQQIDIARLKARPTSTSCVECKKALTNEF